MHRRSHPEDDISIHADGHKYHTFTPEQIEFIASQAPFAAIKWDEHFAENPEE